MLNACGGIVAPGSSCTVGVSYTPSSTASQTGTLTIQDDAPGNPQTVQLSGSETDVAFTVASGSSTSATIISGQTATYNLAVTPTGGFTGTLAVSCTGAPAGMQCVGSPTSLSITAASPVSVTFTVSPTTSAENESPFKGSTAAGVLALALLFGLFSGAYRRAGKSLGRCSVIVFACALLLMGSACGGGSSSPAPPPNPTPFSTTYVLNAVLTTASRQQVQQALVLTVDGVTR